MDELMNCMENAPECDFAACCPKGWAEVLMRQRMIPNAGYETSLSRLEIGSQTTRETIYHET
jgi:hypothetical protein